MTVSDRAHGSLDDIGIPGRRVDQPAACSLVPGIRIGDGRQEAFGIGVHAIVVDLAAGAQLQQMSAAHDTDLVADIADHGKVMGNEEIGHVQLSLQVLSISFEKMYICEGAPLRKL